MNLKRRLSAVAAAVAVGFGSAIVTAPEAHAAAYMSMDCAKRLTHGLRVIYFNSEYSVKCANTYGAGGNSITHVRDVEGPICVYFNGALAGCASKGQWAYVGNRSGQLGTVKTQPLGS